MCEVIALSPRPTPRSPAVAGGAEILFFMGVRYHRMSDEEFEKATAKPLPSAKAKAPRSARKRA